ncbi:uncharacterized protein [Oscarella lobularis]|uniref:uncharacterized protein n=1 Tax=Oscarella lobularis TaxID=121494 RepID=UPI00331388F5
MEPGFYEDRVAWLREQYVESSAHYVSVADVHNDLRIYANVDLSSTEMGRVTKRAFPHISRTKRSIGWTYTGIRKKIKIETRESSTQATSSIDWEAVHRCLSVEMQNLVSSDEGYLDVDVTEQCRAMRAMAPNLWRVMGSVMGCRNKKAPDDFVLNVVSLMMKQRSRMKAAKAFPQLTSLFLISHAAPKQVLAAMNTLGLCMSYTASWDYLRTVASKNVVPERQPFCPRILSYDNLNITKNVHHERQGHHQERWDMTTRLIIDYEEDVVLQSLPLAQKSISRSSLRDQDILPSPQDNDSVFQSGVDFIMRFLVSRFKSFFPLSNVSPKRKHHKQPTKARITPLPILDVNEGKTDGNITVLDSFAADIRKKDITPEAVVGDQLTCKNIRGAKRLRTPEPCTLNTLHWAKESPGKIYIVTVAN